MSDEAERDRAEAARLVRAGYSERELRRMSGTALGLALQVRPDGPGRAWLTMPNGMEIPLDVSAEVARRNLLGFCRRFGLGAEARAAQRRTEQLAFDFMAELPRMRRPAPPTRLPRGG